MNTAPWSTASTQTVKGSCGFCLYPRLEPPSGPEVHTAGFIPSQPPQSQGTETLISVTGCWEPIHPQDLPDRGTDHAHTEGKEVKSQQD